MERTPLYNLIHSIENPTLVQSFILPSLNIIFHNGSEQEVLTVEGLAPFHTIEDLHRALWIQNGKKRELYPKYSFLGVEEEPNQFTPAMGTFYDERGQKILLPNPETVIAKNTIQSFFVGSGGERKIVTYLQRGRTTIEDAFIQPMGGIPTFHVFSFQSLLSLYKGRLPVSQRDWNGLFFPYFPSLNYTMTKSLDIVWSSGDKAQSQQAETYISAKLNQVDQLNSLLDYTASPEIRTSSIQYLSFQWTDKFDDFEGVDSLFYRLPVSSVRPYIRLLTPNSTPMTKLYKPDPVALPQVSDPVLLNGWVSEPPPILNSSFLVSKLLLRKEDAAVLPLYGTFQLIDDTTAVFVIQPPKDVRSLDFQHDMPNLSDTITAGTEGMPIQLQHVKLGRANLTIDFQFKTIKPPIKQLRARFDSFNTLFQHITPPKEEQSFMLSLRYKAISNFAVNDDKISAYLLYYFSRMKFQPGQEDQFVRPVATEFQISEEEAKEYIKKFLQEGIEHTTADSEGREFLAVSNPGIDIGIYSPNVNTYSIHFYNVRAITIDVFLSLCSVLSLVFYSENDTWNSIVKSKDSVSKLEESIESVEKDDLEEERIASTTTKPMQQEPSLDDLAYIDENEYELEELEDAELAGVEEESIPQETIPQQLQITTKEKLKKPLPVDANSDSQRIIAHEWFINQLKRLDPVLFDHKPDESKGESHYSSKCAANEDRYPAVLTHEEYNTMLNYYAKDKQKNHVAFVLYGDPQTDAMIKAAETVVPENRIYVMKYGSDPKKVNYYLCSLFFCLRDKLPILQDDWKSTEDKEGNEKPENSCPFCHGRLITNRRKPELGETVIRRKDKPGGSKTYIRFLKESHPSGYGLPCCFIRKVDTLWKDPYFDKMRQAVSSTESVLKKSKEDDEDRMTQLHESLKIRSQQAVSYEVLRYRISREYVLGPEKYPLEPGKIGMPNLAIDAYFGQNSSEAVSRSRIKQEFKPTASGFFRVGVLNKVSLLEQSLFSALAPLLGKSTIQEVQRHFADLITPRIFVNLNFGNLLLEFFKPTDALAPIGVLNQWVRKWFQNDKQGDNEYELQRLYRSYHRFIQYIYDPTQKKQLRHFAHALAEPNLLAPNGLTILTLEYQGDARDQSTDIQVRCPMLGFESERYTKNMIGFLTVNASGIWEPIIYVAKLNRVSITPIEHEGYYVLPYSQVIQPEFPEIVRSRYTEFITRCRSSYRGAFTMQSGVDNRALLPVSKALELLQPLNPVGIVRDSYNHLVAITVRGTSRSQEILVPVVDDGNSFHSNTGLNIHLGLQTVQLAFANDVYTTYKKYIEPRIGQISASYILSKFIRTTRVIGYILGGPNAQSTISLPCVENAAAAAAIKDLPIQQLEPNVQFKFEYQLNREIMMDDGRSGEYEQPAYLIKKKQVEDIYQHLRYSFSTWIATEEDGQELRLQTESLLQRTDLPFWEKMRRLQIEYGSLLESWFAPDSDPYTVEPVLLRNDCISIEEEGKCTGTCSFQDGSCKIHTPDKIQVNSNGERIDAVSYFSTRLFDELLRIPAKRQELFSKGVRRIQVPTTDIQIGDQWILPENVPAWYDLLREPERGAEVAHYYEEFSKQEDEEDEEDDKNEEEQLRKSQLAPLPEQLQALLPEGSSSKLGLRLVGSPKESRSQAILRYFGMESTDTSSSKNLLDPTELSQLSRKHDTRPVIQIVLQQMPTGIIGRKFTLFENKSGVLIVVPDYEEGPAVLVVVQDGSYIIPESLIVGPLLDSVQVEKRQIIKRKVATQPPAKSPAKSTV
jgi:hypothetical protein